MEKKYKLKEEVKKYFTKNLHDTKEVWRYWVEQNVREEALEEVEERIELCFGLSDNSCLYKFNKYKGAGREEWTEQEREGIEKFLNVFGSWDKIDVYVSEWFTYCANADLNFKTMTFTEYLKEKGYE